MSVIRMGIGSMHLLCRIGYADDSVLEISLFNYDIVLGWLTAQCGIQILYIWICGPLLPLHLELFGGPDGLLFAFCDHTDEVPALNYFDQSRNILYRFFID